MNYDIIRKSDFRPI
uniref:Uncharacterized protein n=1 Tax=Rhizophora mucronata TaxID=61149 RepID=A0A2P2PI42_RHIMU